MEVPCKTSNSVLLSVSFRFLLAKRMRLLFNFYKATEKGLKWGLLKNIWFSYSFHLCGRVFPNIIIITNQFWCSRSATVLLRQILQLSSQSVSSPNHWGPLTRAHALPSWRRCRGSIRDLHRNSNSYFDWQVYWDCIYFFTSLWIFILKNGALLAPVP